MVELFDNCLLVCERCCAEVGELVSFAVLVIFCNAVFLALCRNFVVMLENVYFNINILNCVVIACIFGSKCCLEGVETFVTNIKGAVRPCPGALGVAFGVGQRHIGQGLATDCSQAGRRCCGRVGRRDGVVHAGYGRRRTCREESGIFAHIGGGTVKGIPILCVGNGILARESIRIFSTAQSRRFSVTVIGQVGRSADGDAESVLFRTVIISASCRNGRTV